MIKIKRNGALMFGFPDNFGQQTPNAINQDYLKRAIIIIYYTLT